MIPRRPRAARPSPVGSGAIAARSSRRAELLALLPQGRMLPAEAWAVRHRTLVALLWLHVLVLPVFTLARGHGVVVAVGAVVPIAVAGVVAGVRSASRRARSIAVVYGLLTSSAVLVNAWDGQIEAHFHFFVVIAIVALYEDWVPFGLAVGYVLVEHGVLGAISQHSVYNHDGNPFAWGAIHALFVLGAVAASVTTWRLNEDMRTAMDDAHGHAAGISERFRLAFESGPSGMALSAPDGRFLKVNAALCTMIGYSEAELLAGDFQSITHPDDLGRDVEQLHALVDGRVDGYATEKRYRHREGQDVWVELGVTAVRGKAHEVLYFIVQSHDVSKRRLFEAELARRALHDPLTGLPNRALLADRTGHALQRLRRRSGGVALLFVDLDRFKLVNDGMGHEAGDAVLLEAAQRLCEVARAGDTVARFGGDEFAILCEEVTVEGACEIADRVVAAFSRPFAHYSREFHLSASVGVRFTDSSTSAPEAVLREADMAMYAAKRQGRARYSLFDPATERVGADRLGAEHALRLAVGRDELVLHYQPEVCLETGRILALEALVRWQHPERGLLAPGEFIPVAEESDLIVSLGQWVLGEACTQLARWRRAGPAGPELRMAVNVAARQLADPRLPQTVEEALGDAGLEPHALCLEVTESAALQDTDVVRENLRALNVLGVGLALDDFGVGFASLSQIRVFPPLDVIKVDRSFTAGLGSDGSDRAVVRAVLSLAGSLGASCVAEGVENPEQLEVLRELGCTIGQGYYFARPDAPEAVERLLLAAPPPVALPAP